MVELLAPARDMRSVSAAINNHADSIYVGLSDYNMRSNIANIDINDLADIVNTCHDNNVKLYVCTNTIVDNNQVEQFRKQLPILESLDVDALIISDMGLINIANKSSIPIHLSIQANVTNNEALKLYSDLGVTRAVLSRELSLEDIKNIKRNSPIEIETFIHGAMCVAISGRCFLSAYFYDRNANRGECLQPCRQPWTLNSIEGKQLLLEEPDNNILEHSRLLSPQDMCMIEHVPELLDVKIDAFKIEGRARPSDYVATVTRVYHEAIELYHDGLWDEHIDENLLSWYKELKSVFNRGFDTGFYYRKPVMTSKDNQATYKKKDIGVVTNYYKKVNVAEVKLWQPLSINDEIIIQGNKTGSITQTVKSMQIDGKNVDNISEGFVGIKLESIVRANDHVYKKIINEE
ncbi:MAG: U32 family peptidase [Methanosphaera sp.]|nr:U32 family peptidase [Methanosphaera sp.]